LDFIYALTGPPGCGKTTAILKIVKYLSERNVVIDGMYTEEIRISGKRVGFKVTRISSGEYGVMAHVEFKEKTRVGKYGVKINVLEEIGVKAIIEGLEKAEVIVVDEVGPMELYSNKFVVSVEKLLQSSKPSILTVHFQARHPLVNSVKKLAGRKLFILTQENRDKIPIQISEEILSHLKRSKNN